MKALIIGNGGREHALAWKIEQSSLVDKVFVAPGNGGTALEEKIENINISVNDIDKLVSFAKEEKVDLTIIGPEVPLSKGIVDTFIENKLKVFGPKKLAAQLESSKDFAKSFMYRHQIPTAKYKTFTNIKDAHEYINKEGAPIVIKADGLAAGKGVAICKTKKEVLSFSEKIFKGKFKTSKKLVLEEFLKGEEVSYFLIVDKNSFKFFGSAQDHKRVGEKEKGLNTGGMGAYSPAPIITKILEDKIINRIVQPTLSALKKKNKNYKGFLYVGLMIVNNDPYLIEYNVRMGDPECQVILPRLNTDV